RILANQRKYYSDHPDVRKRATQKYSQKHKERIHEFSRKWRVNNREKVNIKTHRRRANKRHLPNNFTPEQWKVCLDYWQHRCAVCDAPQGLWHTLAMDHWIPLSDIENCPGTIAENIVPLCHTRKNGEGGCNNSKGKHRAENWLAEKYGKRKARQI